MFQDAYRYTTGGRVKQLTLSLIDPGLQACICYRIGNWLCKIGLGPLAQLTWRLGLSLSGADIPPRATIGRGLSLPHPQGVIIGRHAVLGEDCTLYDHVTVGVREWPVVGDELEAYPTLGDRVKLYSGCKVLGPISLGDDAIVGANAVVLSSVPAASVAVGLPARVVKGPQAPGTQA
jgi:serine O-acetyltransferase